MFNPFGDLESAGYLRNRRQDKEEKVIKRMEHAIFRMGLPEALANLRKTKQVSYEHVQAVHKTLFQNYYPWAGTDRLALLPEKNITKGTLVFCSPQDIRRAMEYALALAQDKKTMSAKPGEVLGGMAYAHPFLDGNGRTLLTVMTDLTRRAGYEIQWSKLNPESYLLGLTQEIQTPGQSNLNALLLAVSIPLNN
jgi:cell filamentation protein